MGRDRGEKKPKKAGAILAGLKSDIRSLNSSVLLISQKIKYLVRNEKILGRNLIVLNKKIKTIEERISSGEIAGTQAGQEGLSQDVAAKLDVLDRKLNEIQAELESVKQGTASAEQIQELKYVIDSINPLDLATLEQVKELIDGKMKKKKATA